jgi:hypothetical protein
MSDIRKIGVPPGGTTGQVLKKTNNNDFVTEWGTGGSGASAFTDLSDVPNNYTGDALKVVRVNAGETALEFATVSGTGDVVGPASATSGAVVLYDGTTGKLIKNSTILPTTVGIAIANLTNPSAVTFIRINADNTVTARTAAEMLSDIGAQAAGSYLTAANIVATITNGVTTNAPSEDAVFDALAGKEPLKGADDNYVTDAEKVVIGNTSGTNTGDQTITNTSDATSHTVTLSASGGSVQLIEGTNITLTTGGTGAAGTVTIAASGGISGLNTGYITKASSATAITDSIINESSGLIGISTAIPNRVLHVTVANNGTSSVTPSVRFDHVIAGTPAIGAGSSIELGTETSTDNIEIGGTIESVSTDVTLGSEDFDLVLKTMAAGATVAEGLRIKSTKQLQLAGYTGTGSYSGTAVGYLQFDASGNIITASLPSGSGGLTLGAANALFTGQAMI